jgi:hypothetical protein
LNILIVTDEGKILGFADRLNSEGHTVHVFSRGNIGAFASRLYQYQDNLMKGINDCKFVLCDIDGWTYLDQRVASSKRPVIGSHALASMVNNDAIKQYQLFKKFGLPTSRTEIFDDASESIGSVLNWDANRTVIRYLDREFRCDYRDWLAWAMLRVPVGQKVLFQELAIGYEALVTGWFDGFDWVDAFSIAPVHSFHLNKFAVVAPLAMDKPLVQQTLLKLTEYLKHWEYRGPVHLEAILTEGEFKCHGLHVGFIFPLDYTLIEFVQGEVARFFNGIAYPNNFKVNKTKDYVGAVQAMCNGSDLSGAPILGLNPERMKHFVFHNATVDITDGTYQVGPPPVKEVFTAFAHGPSIGQMCERVYQTVESVKFPEKHFNGNMAAVVSPTFERFKSWGYIG